MFSGLRPLKQLERSKLFIYHDDSVKVRRKSEEPSQGARPSAVTALSPGGWQLMWGDLLPSTGFVTKAVGSKRTGQFGCTLGKQKALLGGTERAARKSQG